VDRPFVDLVLEVWQVNFGSFGHRRQRRSVCGLFPRSVRSALHRQNVALFTQYGGVVYEDRLARGGGEHWLLASGAEVLDLDLEPRRGVRRRKSRGRGRS
jgi:hypothetical protein